MAYNFNLGIAELYGLTSGKIFGAHSQTIGGSGTTCTVTVTDGVITQNEQLGLRLTISNTAKVDSIRAINLVMA